MKNSDYDACGIIFNRKIPNKHKASSHLTVAIRNNGE